MTSPMCKVKNCRFPHSHVTMGHKCGKCNDYGHGNMECGSEQCIINLSRNYGKEVLIPCDYCQVPNCPTKNLHKTCAHQCQFCGDRHSEQNCKDINIPTYSFKCPVCRTPNTLTCFQTKVSGSNDRCVICLEKNVQIYNPNCGHICMCESCMHTLSESSIDIKTADPNNPTPFDRLFTSAENALRDLEMVYTTSYAGMGCQMYLRRTRKDSPIEGFFMHNDSWGQYGPQTDDRPKLNAFKYGYRMVPNLPNISDSESD